MIEFAKSTYILCVVVGLLVAAYQMGRVAGHNKAVRDAPTPAKLWDAFIVRLNRDQPLGTVKEPLQHQNFIGSISKYRSIFLAANTTPPPQHWGLGNSIRRGQVFNARLTNFVELDCFNYPFQDNCPASVRRLNQIFARLTQAGLRTDWRRWQWQLRASRHHPGKCHDTQFC